MKIQIEDTVYEGTAAGIMEQLRDLSFDPTEFPDVETYIWFVQNNVIRTLHPKLCGNLQQGVE